MRTWLLCALLSSPGSSFWSRMADPLAQPSKLFEAGQYAQVVAQLPPEALQRLRGSDLRRAYLLLGTSLERVERIDDALGVYQLGVKLFPRDLNLLTQLAALLHHAGLEERAEPLFQKVISIHPNNASANLGLAEIDHALGFLDRSAEHYEKALESPDATAETWSSYGEVLHEMRDDKTAELAFRRSLQLAPRRQSQLGLGFALRAQDRLDDALTAVSSLPGDDAALLTSLWLLEAGRPEEALARVAPVLTAAPDDPLARYVRARVRLKQDRYNEAVADLAAAALDARRSPFVAQMSAALLARLKGRRP